MDTIDLEEAKTRFSELLDRVQQGERLRITKEGVPIAMLLRVAKKAAKDEDIARVIEQMKEFSRRDSLTGLSLREMIDEGRAGVS